MDIVPGNNMCTNEKEKNGAYKEVSVALEHTFSSATLGTFIGNDAYTIHATQGVMGARCLKAVCRAKSLPVSAATPPVYEVLGFDASTQCQFTSTDTFGICFIGHGKQLVLKMCSLGSGLAGPTSGGGDSAVITATSLANVVRALQGRPPIKMMHSPLLCLTTGQGRTDAQLKRVLDEFEMRGTDEWVHPSVTGGMTDAKPETKEAN
eukprot:CAMPEP_0119298370 /NCGR_PEP_ID=MMETSP1333-20130426/575_1 /TAXON_ID=418940 /ORGANISM="Scyphosphaera apsteinii, Strain RCC1455" /LENGTH=206 /DNA_ID=CAMNT_0007299459 /DNA_START=269 /DNA_END=886 /DNA_ORIENTATION=-